MPARGRPTLGHPVRAGFPSIGGVVAGLRQPGDDAHTPFLLQHHRMHGFLNGGRPGRVQPELRLVGVPQVSQMRRSIGSR